MEESKNREQQFLQVLAGAIIDPLVVLAPVRDPAGAVTDFIYRDVNPIACADLGARREELIGRSLIRHSPIFEQSGLAVRCARLAETGEPMILDEFELAGAIIDRSHRYDIRGVRAPDGLLIVTYRDVTERYESRRRLAESEQRYRLVVENVTDVVGLIGDDATITWATPSIEYALGAPVQYWVGRSAIEATYPDDLSVASELLAEATAKRESVKRFRLVDAQQRVRWFEFHCSRFLDTDGNPDGFIAAFRLIDDEVAAEQAAQEARSRQADADEIYRRLVEDSPVPTCMSRSDGIFAQVNDAFCQFFGYDADILLSKTWVEVSGPDERAADPTAMADLVAGRVDSLRFTGQYVHADGHPIWGEVFVARLRSADGDVQGIITQIVDVTAEVQARAELEATLELLAASAESMIDPQVVLEAVRGPAGLVSDFTILRGNRAAKRCLGVSIGELDGRPVSVFQPNLESSGLLARYVGCLDDGKPLVLNDFPLTVPRLDEDRRFDIRAAPAGLNRLSVTSSDVTERFQLVQTLSESETYYRLLADNSTDVVARTRDDTTIIWVSPSVEQALGAPPEYWIGRSAVSLTHPDDLPIVADILNGADDGQVVRRRLRVLDAQQQPHWAEFNAGRFRGADGSPDGFITSFQVIDDEVAAEQALEAARREQTKLTRRLSRELASAAAYMTSIIPRELTGLVEVASRYLPSHELGGDCFDFRWIDDDHLLVYLLDVSGHGLEPALLAVSVHNLLRSGSLPVATLAAPAELLRELNDLFQMEQHDGHYFTIWAGVYESSSRTLRYANAGAPPALVFGADNGVGALIELPATSEPVGMFPDTVFAEGGLRVAPGCRVLLFSDGIYELDSDDRRQDPYGALKARIIPIAGSPEGVLDFVDRELASQSASGAVRDDRSVIQLTFT